MFRPSVYRVCVRILHKWYDGKKDPPPPHHFVMLLRDDLTKMWRREGISKPSVREASMAAQVYCELRREDGRTR